MFYVFRDLIGIMVKIEGEVETNAQMLEIFQQARRGRDACFADLSQIPASVSQLRQRFVAAATEDDFCAILACFRASKQGIKGTILLGIKGGTSRDFKSRRFLEESNKNREVFTSIQEGERLQADLGVGKRSISSSSSASCFYSLC
jgi:hypothetical protein